MAQRLAKHHALARLFGQNAFKCIVITGLPFEGKTSGNNPVS